ncbi:MAG: DUF2905 domain-containing protein [Desulfuromonadaceae bacterium]|nr:DUF2905 domain-containing protein [Desulfuromonadaceae bacterium]
MQTGKLLIVLGLVLLGLGLLFTFVDRLPFLGKLPGDIRIEKGNFTFYLPLGTCILISLLLSLLLWLFKR